MTDATNSIAATKAHVTLRSDLMGTLAFVFVASLAILVWAGWGKTSDVDGTVRPIGPNPQISAHQ